MIILRLLLLLPLLLIQLLVVNSSYKVSATSEMQPVVVGGGSNELLGLTGPPRCEEITIPMCRGVGYNLTYMPNELNHDNQEEAGYEVHQFWPLVEIQCSPELKFFLCSMYTPICFEDYQKPLKACRSVCQRARDGCEPLMSQYGFKWPERMNCDKLPVQGDEHVLCMEPPEYSKDQTGNGGVGGIYHPGLMSPNFGFRPQLPVCKPGSSNKAGTKNCVQQQPADGDCSCRCRSPLITLERNSAWYNRSVSVGGINNCAVPCAGVFFSDEEKELAANWLTLWAGLCSAATLMTLITFLIDTERFKYPERPIVFLSACYFLVSVGYLIRTFVGPDEIVCEAGTDMIVYSASGPKVCTLVFLLIYFFGMSSSIWWVILTFTWFLAAGFKWSNEAIASYSQYFHLAAWLIPTVKSVGVLIMSGVDGDSLIGICYVGNQNPANLRKFVLIPLIIYLIIGTSFLVAGFVSLFRIRNVIKKQSGLGGRSKADKLEKLMIRIGIFSLMYTLPATVLIGCYYYESSLYNDWMTALVCPCSATGASSSNSIVLDGAGANSYGISGNNKQQSSSSRMIGGRSVKPIYAVMMLKYFMALAVGITSGVWIWSGKTVGSWKKLWKRLFGKTGGTAGGKNHKSTLIGNNNNSVVVGAAAGTKTRCGIAKQQYMPPPSIPIPPVPASSSTLLSGPHINAGGSSVPSTSQFMGGCGGSSGIHQSTAANLHHHMIKQQSQQAPLSHV